MSEQQPDRVTLRRRERRAAEMILDNSALRDALDDTQAQKLLDWALARLSAAVQQTQTLSDEAAEPMLEEATSAVAGVMRHINELVAHPIAGSPAAETPKSGLGALSRQVALAHTLALPTTEQLDQVARQQGPAALFDSLMNALEAPAPDAAVPEPAVPVEPAAPAPEPPAPHGLAAVAAALRHAWESFTDGDEPDTAADPPPPADPRPRPTQTGKDDDITML